MRNEVEKTTWRRLKERFLEKFAYSDQTGILHAIHPGDKLNLEMLEPRVLLNTASFRFESGLNPIFNTVMTVQATALVSMSLYIIGIEAFQHSGSFNSATVDFGNSSDELGIGNWSTDSKLDSVIDDSLDTGTADDSISVGSSSGIKGGKSKEILLGTFELEAPDEAGVYELSIDSFGTNFFTSFGPGIGVNDFGTLNVIVEKSDWGDAPDSFGTTLLNNGPEHTIVPGVNLGAAIDNEIDGRPTFNADGDDIDLNGDDEDGVIFNAPLYAGLPAEMTVTASQAGFLDAWIDYNGNGVFDPVPTPTAAAPGPNPPDEYLPNMILGHVGGGASYPLDPGANVINFFVPNVIDADISYARFRFSTAGGLGPTGLAADGEVEDYQVQLYPLAPDMGDAPEPYPTLLADDGAVHLMSIDSFTLGEKRDSEIDGMPDADALGDDDHDGRDFPIDTDPDDEDGVTIDTMLPGTLANIEVTATVPIVIYEAKLDGWIDWNQDGDWDDDGEQIFDSEPVYDGINNLTTVVPVGAVVGDTFARFRLSALGGLEPTGVSTSGEVEDYQVVIDPNPLPIAELTPEEQHFIYLLNRARHDPAFYETDANLAVSLDGIVPRPPLAVNPYLTDSSGFHAEEMAEFDYFEHQSDVTGDWPNKMAIDAGYNLPFPLVGNQIESIAAGSGLLKQDTADKVLKLLIEDIGVPGVGHRLHLMGQGGWGDHREIGAGYSPDGIGLFTHYWAIHTGYENTSDTFLTGVVYDDLNGNNIYDQDEGLGGVTVATDSGDSVLTNSAGGWSIPVSAGMYLVTVSGGEFIGTSSALAVVDTDNVEVDFTSGETAGVIDFDEDAGAGLPTVTVTASDSDAAENGPDEGVFTITRTGDTTDPLFVIFAFSGSAAADDDYIDPGALAVISSGETSTTVTLTPVDDDDIEGRETIELTLLASTDYQIGDDAAAAIGIADDEGAIVKLIPGEATSVTYTEPDGTVGTASVRAAGATVIFTGENVVVQENGKTIIVTSDGGAVIDEIHVLPESMAASLAFKASGGDGFLDVNNINIDGSAKDVKGRQVNLLGDMTVAGTLIKLDLNNVDTQHTITIGGSMAAKPVNMKFNEVTDLTINSDTPIKSILVNDWEDTDATDDEINAPYIVKITSKDDFAAGLNLTDTTGKATLGSVKVADAITGGTWNIAGNGGSISAFSIGEDWQATFGGTLAKLATKGDASGDLTALAIKSLAVKGDYTNANVTATQAVDPDDTKRKIKAISKLSVSGDAENLEIRSAGHIGSVSIGRLLNSNVFAGVNDAVTALPAALADLDAEALIGNLKIKGSKTEPVWIQNSNIAAYEFGKIAFSNAEIDNGDTEFGLAAGAFKGISYKDATHKVAVKNSDITGFTNLVDLDDLIVRLLA